MDALTSRRCAGDLRPRTPGLAPVRRRWRRSCWSFFDVLHLDGRAVRALPYHARRALLADVLPESERWRLAPSWTNRHDDVVKVTRAHELEGVVFKRLELDLPARAP
jgi:ATP-dependent DNA ligase